MTALTRWQALLDLPDREAARQLGLDAVEFYRQRAFGASAQTALLACLIALFRSPMGTLLATAATLDAGRAQAK